jgi:hypothetical protein
MFILYIYIYTYLSDTNNSMIKNEMIHKCRCCFFIMIKTSSLLGGMGVEEMPRKWNEMYYNKTG